MREIKFRAWDLLNNKLLPVVNLCEVYVEVSPENDDDEGNETYELQHSLFDDGSGTVDSELMQFTGLQDKNGKDIYEGDICKDIEGIISEVAYEGSAFILGSDGYIDDYILLFNCELEEFEIIGNKYENPELLK